jgi:hypothetical protein
MVSIWYGPVSQQFMPGSPCSRIFQSFGVRLFGASFRSRLFISGLLLTIVAVRAADLPVNLAGNVISEGKFFTIIGTNEAMISGSNVAPGTSRVVVNGDDAVYIASSTSWTKSQVLQPGLNPLFIAGLNADGAIVASTNVLILYQTAATALSGTLGSNTVWSKGMGVIHVTNNVIVSTGKTLTIAPGTIVLFGAGTGISVAGGSLQADGTTEDPILFGPLDGSKEWGPISVANSGGIASVRHAESIAGRFTVSGNATLLLEDCQIHHYYSGSMLSGSGGTYTLRRLHLHHYHDSNMNSALVHAEDCLIEDCDSTDGDPFEMSDALKGTLIQRVTLRRSSGNNADAFDLNSGNGVTYIDNLVHDVTDKGFSIGTAGGPPSQNITVSNNLVWNAHTGIAIKDGSTANVIGNTIVDCAFGIQAYPKYSANGGHLTNGYNNILWNNGVTLVITNGSMDLNDSDLGGSVFWNTNSADLSGTHNIDADPLFVDSVSRDYHLASASPALGTGRGGSDMGVVLPVGGPPGAPSNLTALISNPEFVRLVWQDNADNESSFLVFRSQTKTNWNVLATAPVESLQYMDATGVNGQKYYYRIQATNSSGSSAFSNIAGAPGTSFAPPRIDSIEFSGSGLALGFAALAGQTYTIQSRDAIDSAHPWLNLQQIQAQTQTTHHTANLEINQSATRFYRIVTPAQF